MTSALENLIIVAIDKHSGEVHGVETMAFELGCHNVSWIRKLLKRGEASGQLDIVHKPAGRGHKNIIKRNRNCAGLPRKVHTSS
jgi:hypothetical protein